MDITHFLHLLILHLPALRNLSEFVHQANISSNKIFFSELRFDDAGVAYGTRRKLRLKEPLAIGIRIVINPPRQSDLQLFPVAFIILERYKL